MKAQEHRIEFDHRGFYGPAPYHCTLTLQAHDAFEEFSFVPVPMMVVMLRQALEARDVKDTIGMLSLWANSVMESTLTLLKQAEWLDRISAIQVTVKFGDSPRVTVTRDEDKA